MPYPIKSIESERKTVGSWRKDLFHYHTTDMRAPTTHFTTLSFFFINRSHLDRTNNNKKIRIVRDIATSENDGDEWWFFENVTETSKLTDNFIWPQMRKWVSYQKITKSIVTIYIFFWSLTTSNEKKVSKLNICTKAREHNNDSHKYSCVKLSCYQHIFFFTHLLTSLLSPQKNYIYMLCVAWWYEKMFIYFFLYFTSNTYTQTRGFLCDNHINIIFFCSTAALRFEVFCNVSLSIAF